jgi:hypothetical protein
MVTAGGSGRIKDTVMAANGELVFGDRFDREVCTNFGVDLWS